MVDTMFYALHDMRSPAVLRVVILFYHSIDDEKNVAGLQGEPWTTLFTESDNSVQKSQQILVPGSTLSPKNGFQGMRPQCLFQYLPV